MIQRTADLQQAITNDARAHALASSLDTCPYAEVRDRMIDIEIIYGGREGVPQALVAEIGQRIRRRSDYATLAAWNGQDPEACQQQGYGPRAIVVAAPKGLARIFAPWSWKGGGA